MNEKEICFTKEVENFDDYENALVLRFFDEQLSEFMIDLLTNGKRIETIFIVTPNPNDDFKAFQKHFKIINAAGGVVSNKDGDFLFIHRLDKWDLPKGKLEADEQPKLAAIREVEEECGVSGLSINRDLPSTFHIYEDEGDVVLKQTHWYSMETDFSGDLIPQTEEDITQARWMTQEEVENLVMDNTYASLKQLISEAT